MTQAADARYECGLKIFGAPATLAAVEAYVAQIADAAPPLTTKQKSRLRTLLLPTPSAEPMAPASSNSKAA